MPFNDNVIAEYHYDPDALKRWGRAKSTENKHVTSSNDITVGKTSMTCDTQGMTF